MSGWWEDCGLERELAREQSKVQTRKRAQAEMAEQRRLEIEREERELDARRERIEAAMRRDDERARDFANIRRRRRKAVGLY